MSHQLDMSNNQANMAFVNEKPWHGLGQELTDGATLDVWQEQAGMNWFVKASELNYTAHSPSADFSSIVAEEKVFEGKKVLYRSDTKAALAVVGEAYKIVQPEEILQFFRDLIEMKGFKMETAGCLFGGKKFWALARAGESTKIAGVDEVKPYLLLATSCDGSMATSAHPTSVRVVCNNTLRMAIGPNAEKARIRIPHSAQFDASAVKEQLGYFEDSWSNFINSINSLAQIKLNHDTAIEIVANQLKKEWNDAEGNALEASAMVESSSVLRRIMELYDGAGKGSQLASSQGTGWGLVNAVTEYFDHEAGATANRSRSFERAQLTDRANFKVSVANKILELA